MLKSSLKLEPCRILLKPHAGTPWGMPWLILWLTPCFSSAILPRSARSALIIAMICAGGALPGKTLAEEPLPNVIPGASTAQTGTGLDLKPFGSAAAGRSNALMRVIALRQELEAQVKAIARLVAYQKELIDLANTRDREAAIAARRPRQSCRQDINSAAICDALSVSFGDDDTPEQAGGAK